MCTINGLYNIPVHEDQQIHIREKEREGLVTQSKSKGSERAGNQLMQNQIGLLAMQQAIGSQSMAKCRSKWLSVSDNSGSVALVIRVSRDKEPMFEKLFILAPRFSLLPAGPHPFNLLESSHYEWDADRTQ